MEETLKREREQFNKAEQAADAARNRLVELVNESNLLAGKQLDILLAVFELYRTAGLEGIARMSLQMSELRERQKELENAH